MKLNLLEKIFFNYNQFFINKTYLSLFDIFEKHINKNNSVLLNNFINTLDIEEQTKILFELFKISKKNDEKIIQKKFDFNQCYQIKDGIFEKINNYYYFESDTKNIYIIKYEKEDKLIYNPNFCPKFNEKIYSVSISKENSQIYACLSNEKRVIIFDFNLKNKEITINN